MKYKNIFIANFLIFGLVTPHFLFAQVTPLPLHTAQFKEEKITKIQQLLEQIKALQEQLEILKNKEVAGGAPITAADYTHGNADARVQILAYTDINCPFCKTFHTTLNSLVKENPDISVTYRHFPIEQLHPNAKTLAIAAECAGMIKGDVAFFEVMDSLFDSRSLRQGADKRSISSAIKEAGISNTTFSDCKNGQVAENAVEADMADGMTRGVQGTPTSFVFKDGKLIESINGSQPFDAIQILISDLLK